MMLSFILFFQLRDTGLYTRLCHLVGRSVGWSNHFLPLTCIGMYMYVSISNNYLTYATRCCVCDIGVSHMQHDVA